MEDARQMVFVTYPIYNCPFPGVSTLRVQVETIVKIMPKIRLILWFVIEANYCIPLITSRAYY